VFEKRGNMEEDVLIFVDGELYKGVVTFNNYKGIGWPGVVGFILRQEKAARYQEVLMVDIRYGKARKCQFNSQGCGLKDQLKAKTTYWDVIYMPGD
jgi:hypothetical protein